MIFFKNRLFFLLLSISLVFFLNSNVFSEPKKNRKKYILSIDGGGIRGILPALTLQRINDCLTNYPSYSDKHISDFFDLAAGTSTGGLIVAMLFKNNPVSIEQVIDLYKNEGTKIFKKRHIDENIFDRISYYGVGSSISLSSQSLKNLMTCKDNLPFLEIYPLLKSAERQDLNEICFSTDELKIASDVICSEDYQKEKFKTKSIAALIGPKYDEENLTSILRSQFKKSNGEDGRFFEMFPQDKAVLITAYDIFGQKNSGHKPIQFTNWIDDNKKFEDDFSKLEVYKILRATSAAPTYFKPQKILEKRSFIDGGVVANNPALLALIHGGKKFGLSEGSSSLKENFVLLSLGTGVFKVSYDFYKAENWGQAEWIFPLLEILFQGNSNLVSQQLDYILGDNHIRIEFDLPEELSAMDKPQNVTSLEYRFNGLYNKPDSDLRLKVQKICNMLKNEVE